MKAGEEKSIQEIYDSFIRDGNAELSPNKVIRGPDAYNFHKRDSISNTSQITFNEAILLNDPRGSNARNMKSNNEFYADGKLSSNGARRDSLLEQRHYYMAKHNSIGGDNYGLNMPEFNVGLGNRSSIDQTNNNKSLTSMSKHHMSMNDKLDRSHMDTSQYSHRNTSVEFEAPLPQTGLNILGNDFASLTIKEPQKPAMIKRLDRSHKWGR